MLIITSSCGVVLDCTFKNHTSYWGTKYACVVDNLKTSLRFRTVTEVLGEHQPGKSNSDVEKVMISHQNCPYLPIDLGKYFKNLEVLYVMRSNVEHLTTDDLIGLDKLKIFDVSYNPITQITKDYFKGHETLEIISFYDCKLEFVERGALDPLVNLKEGHFEGNICVRYRGDDESKIEVLKEEIKSCEFHTWDDYGDPTRRTELPTTTQATTTTTASNSNETSEPEIPNSFLRRNALAIVIVLLIVISALVGVLYKLNAFNRQNWR